MKSTELLGTEAKSFIEWVGDNILKSVSSSLPAALYINDLNKAHSIYSQPITEDMFVRPEEPKEIDFETGDQYEAGWHKWNEHQVLFKGEWKLNKTKDGLVIYLNKEMFLSYKDIFTSNEGWILIRNQSYSPINTLNDLITNSPVKLEWNLFEV